MPVSILTCALAGECGSESRSRWAASAKRSRHEVDTSVGMMLCARIVSSLPRDVAPSSNSGTLGGICLFLIDGACHGQDR